MAGSHNFGSSNSEPIREDAVFMMASCTKLLTSIAAMQMVEEGRLALDDDVGQILPELAEQQILKGFDSEDRPVLVDRTKPITLKSLLTHTSGLAYDVLHPDLIKYQTQRGHALNTGTTVKERFLQPLSSEPGEQFFYGPSIDWLGKLIEALSHEPTLEEHFRLHIWNPLGLQDSSFWAQSNPDLRGRIPSLVQRNSNQTLEAFNEPHINTGSLDAFGCHGVYASLSDFLEVMRSLLADDQRLLRSATARNFFTPQLDQDLAASLRSFMQSPMLDLFPGELDSTTKINWGLGGMLFEEDDEGRRKRGTLSWTGMTNTFWSIDRTSDLALVFATSLLPPGD